MSLMISRIVLLALLLTGCVKHLNHNDLVRCELKCKQGFSQCLPACKNNCVRCMVRASQSARKHYLRYQHQQSVQGKNIVRELNSYRDPLQCRKTTCNCWADFNVCMQSCRGLIQKSLQVAPTCC